MTLGNATRAAPGATRGERHSGATELRQGASGAVPRTLKPVSRGQGYRQLRCHPKRAVKNPGKNARSQGVKESRSQGVKESEDQGVRSQGVKESRSQGVKISRGSRSQGVKESRSQGVKESRSQGVKESRSQGVKESRSRRGGTGSQDANPPRRQGVPGQNANTTSEIGDSLSFVQPSDPFDYRFADGPRK